MSANNKKLHWILCLAAILLSVLLAAPTEACRRNKTEMARATIENLLRMYPGLVSELSNGQNSQPTNQQARPNAVPTTQPVSAQAPSGVQTQDTN